MNNSGITIAVPKGRLYNDLKEYLGKMDIHLPDENRQYFYKDFFGDGINLFIAKPRSIPQLLESGLCQFGFCGRDIMENYNKGCTDKIIPFINTKLNTVNIVYAVKADHDLTALKRPVICATEYPVIAEKYLVKQKGMSVYILDTSGATEGYVHIGADCIIDVCETGETIKANNLEIKNILFQSSTYLYGVKNIEMPKILEKIQAYFITTLI